MPRIYLRIMASQNDTDNVISALHSLDSVERVEEVADLMPRIQDDSSSAGLQDDVGPGIHTVEVEVPHLSQGDEVRRVAEDAALQSGATVEFIEAL